MNDGQRGEKLEYEYRWCVWFVSRKFEKFTYQDSLGTHIHRKKEKKTFSGIKFQKIK